MAFYLLFIQWWGKDTATGQFKVNSRKHVGSAISSTVRAFDNILIIIYNFNKIINYKINKIKLVYYAKEHTIVENCMSFINFFVFMST